MSRVEPAPQPELTAPELKIIGTIRTPWTSAEDCPRNAMESDVLCRIELDEAFQPGLQSLETCTHAIVLYWLDRSRRDVVTMQPPNDDTAHGVFALRAPDRPNPIGLSVVDIVSIEPDGMTVRHIDCFDGTSLLDIKPYFASVDSKPDAQVGWHQSRAKPLAAQGGSFSGGA